MQLVNDAKTIATKAWSVRLALLGATFSALEMALPLFNPLLPPRTMALLALVASAGAAIARVVAQPEIHPAESSDDK